MNSTTRISVILCTYNRAHSLATALESVATQVLRPPVGWEVLVVDNNSTDNTRQVVEDFQRRYPQRFHYVFERQQGVSNARNAGVREAEGEILAFIDDDETADAGWLQNLTTNLHSGEWIGAGGAVVPQWNGQRPNWWSSTSTFTLGPLAIFNPAQAGDRLIDPPFGANMAFRREAFDEYGLFRTDLGRVGKGMLSGEDTEFGRRLMAAGECLRYEPSALTLHPVDEARLHREYFLRWWFNKGRTDVRDTGIYAERQRFLGIPPRLIRDLVLESGRWMISVEPSRRFICKLKVWTYAGQTFESYHQAVAAKRKRPLHSVNY